MNTERRIRNCGVMDDGLFAEIDIFTQCCGCFGVPLPV
jgi:hypothetical protein